MSFYIFCVYRSILTWWINFYLWILHNIDGKKLYVLISRTIFTWKNQYIHSTRYKYGVMALKWKINAIVIVNLKDKYLINYFLAILANTWFAVPLEPALGIIYYKYEKNALLFPELSKLSIHFVTDFISLWKN